MIPTYVYFLFTRKKRVSVTKSERQVYLTTYSETHENKNISCMSLFLLSFVSPNRYTEFVLSICHTRGTYMIRSEDVTASGWLCIHPNARGTHLFMALYLLDSNRLDRFAGRSQALAAGCNLAA